ncbi:hypothetical protein KEM56_007182 [Ascosphaera pollenicola]|nr:hypothetical protein KEM56_007182 [Ascosphaera pollenicola]
MSDARPGSLSLQDIPHLEEEPEAFRLMKTAINETIAEYAFSFEDDVQDVIPFSGLGLYVVIKHCRRMLNYCIHHYGVFEKLEDAHKLPCHPLIKEHSKLPGPLFNALVFYIKETEEAALFLNNLDLSLRGLHIPSHPSYKLYADSYYFLRNSPAPRAAVNNTIKRLQHVQTPTLPKTSLSIDSNRPVSPEIESLLWPHPRMDFETFPDIPEMPTYSYDAPNLLELIKQHPRLSPKTIMKAATALVAMHENGSMKRAVFFGIEENRTNWPFVPKSFFQSSKASEGTVFESAADVPGPTWNAVINNMRLSKDHSVLDFLYAVQDEQDVLDKFSSVPCYEVFRQLKGHETEVFYLHALRSLVFNWVPLLGDLAASASRPSSSGSPTLRSKTCTQQRQRALSNVTVSQLKSINLENMVIPSFVGCLLTCAVSSEQSDRIVVTFQGAEPTIDPRWTKPVIRKLERVSLWLMDEAVKAEKEGMAGIEEFVKCME